MSSGRGVCGDCNVDVLWVRMHTGGMMPVDVKPADDGTVAVRRSTSGGYTGYMLTGDDQPDPGDRRHVTHFATCRVKLQRAAARKAAADLPATVTAQLNVVAFDPDRRRRSTGRNAGLGLPRGRRGR